MIGMTLELDSKRGKPSQKIQVKRPRLPGAEISSTMHATRAGMIDRKNAKKIGRKQKRAKV